MKHLVKKIYRYFFRKRTQSEIIDDVIAKCIEIVNDDENGLNEQEKNVVYVTLMQKRASFNSGKQFETTKNYNHFQNLAHELNKA